VHQLNAASHFNASAKAQCKCYQSGCGSLAAARQRYSRVAARATVHRPGPGRTITGRYLVGRCTLLPNYSPGLHDANWIPSHNRISCRCVREAWGEGQQGGAGKRRGGESQTATAVPKTDIMMTNKDNHATNPHGEAYYPWAGPEGYTLFIIVSISSEHTEYTMVGGKSYARKTRQLGLLTPLRSQCQPRSYTPHTHLLRIGPLQVPVQACTHTTHTTHTPHTHHTQTHPPHTPHNTQTHPPHTPHTHNTRQGFSFTSNVYGLNTR
jgi:hypothetical protein